MMEKKEYIERGVAKRAIYEYICGHTMSKFLSRELLDASKGGAEGAMYELDYVPAADVVEVVRCGNCKHWASHRAAKYGRCMCVEEIAEGQWHTQADDFCSHGERKEE